jgi:RES domain-containing protein
MSEDFVTAVAAYEQDLGIRPGTLCAYEVDVAGIIDLGDPAVCTTLAIDRAVLVCAWKHIAFVERARPPTWEMAARLAKQGVAGIRVPSARHKEGTNLFLWQWNDVDERQVRALDPLADLPRDQSS